MRNHDGEQPIVCIVGPTASGKSDLAQRVSLKLGAEVVSADSMQIYRGMDIGTGKVVESERLVRHHCLDIVDPGEPYSAALYQKHARAAFSEIAGRGKRIVLCGGTGFYVRAAVDDYEFPAGEQVGNPVRERYLDFAQRRGAHALWEQLNEVDPQSAALIPENDVKRVVRAFELLDDGTNYARQKEKLAVLPQLYPAVFIGLSVEPRILSDRIDARVDKFVESGLVEEVRGLLEQGFREGLTAPQAIGYKEIVAYLDGECALAEALDAIKLATRRYAKRQRTWFRKDKRIRWIDANVYDLDAMAAEAIGIAAMADAVSR